MTHNVGLAIGFTIGLIAGLILVGVLLKFANKDKKIKTEYDERQKEIRNKGYVIGFYTLIILMAVEALWSIFGIEFPMPEYLINFMIMIIGVTVMCSYCIWKGVYWGMNNDPKRYMVIFAIAIFLNFIPIVNAVRKGGMDLNDSIDSLPVLNIIVIAMMVTVLLVMLIRKLTDRSSDGEEE